MICDAGVRFSKISDAKIVVGFSISHIFNTGVKGCDRLHSSRDELCTCLLYSTSHVGECSVIVEAHPIV